MGAVTYHQAMRRCGNRACTRCREKPSHGPYWYAYERDQNGRLHSRYYGKTPPPELAASLPPPPLRIRLLGGFTVERAGIALHQHDWQRASARLLLALLALHPRGLTREQVRAAFWPDGDDQTTTMALKTTLSTLRHVLEPARAPVPAHRLKSRRLPPGEAVLRLHLTDDDWVDTYKLMADADPQRLTHNSLTDLVALYTGDLLPDLRAAEWTATAREALRSRWHALSLHLAQRLMEQGQHQAAVGCLQAVLADEPTQEEAARLLMTSFANQGQRDAALRVYAHLGKALRDELDVTPDIVSQALATRLRDDSTPHPVQASPSEAAERLRERITRLSPIPFK